MPRIPPQFDGPGSAARNRGRFRSGVAGTVPQRGGGAGGGGSEEKGGGGGSGGKADGELFVELQRKIRRHREHILDTIRLGLSNARIEATNNKIKLLIRIAYGFHDVGTMIDLIMLVCSPIEIPWPGREPQTPVKPGAA